MSTFSITRVTRWIYGVATAVLLALFVVAAVVAYRDLPGLLLLAPVALIALLVYGLFDVMSWRSRVWTITEHAIEERRRGGTTTIRWEDVERARFRPLTSALRISARDGRRIDVSYVTKDFARLVLEVERRANAHRVVPLPARFGRALTVETTRVTLGGGFRRRDLDAETLRGWLVGWEPRGPGAGHPVLLLATEDDAWRVPLTGATWLDVAAALRALMRASPRLTWGGAPPPIVPAEVLPAEVAPAEPAPRAPRPRHRRGAWRWTLGVSAAIAAGLVVALTGPPSAPLQRSRAFAPTASAHVRGELEPWLDRHPDDLVAHRALVAAHLTARRRECDDDPILARYTGLSRSSDPVHRAIGSWGLARLQGANGSRDRAIAELARIDVDTIPHAPLDRAALLVDDGRAREAEGVLAIALAGPARHEAAAAYAALLVERGAADELASLADVAGLAAIGAAPARALAASRADLVTWASAHARGVAAGLLALSIALVFGLAALALARFWGDREAPSWTRAIGGAVIGAALALAQSFVEDVAPFLAGLGAWWVVPVGVLVHVGIPVALVLAWQRRHHGTPMALVSRAGIVGAGIGAVTAARWVLTHEGPGAIDAATAWCLAPIHALIVPWTVLWIVDLRQREWARAVAAFGGLALGALAWTAIEIAARLGYDVLALPALYLAFCGTLAPLLANAEALRATPAPPVRSVLGRAALVLVAVPFALVVMLAREIGLGAALVSLGPLLFLTLFGAVVPLSASLTMAPRRWRRDWWRRRP